MNLRDKYLEFREVARTINLGDSELTKITSQYTPSKTLAWEHYMKKCLQTISQPDGLYLEFGVATGQTINFIARQLPSHVIYGFDTFSGLPEDWVASDDIIWPKGYFAQNKIPICRENVRLTAGLFEDTLVPFLRQNLNSCVSFAHIDCDLYSAASFVLEKLEPFMVSGTILCFDEIVTLNDGNFSDACMNGEFRAFSEFVEKYNIEYTPLYHSDVMACVEIAK